MAKNLFATFGARFELGQFYPAYESNLKAIVADSIVPYVKQALVLDASCVAICYWCEGDRPDAKRYAAECVKHAKEYFFGNWREKIPTDLKTPDPSWWRINALWANRFSEALCWAASLGDWKSVERIAEYPTKGIRPGADATREEAAMYLALAFFLRSDAAAQYEDCFETIQKGGNQKAKLVAEVIRTLQKGKANKFQESLEAYLHYFRKREFKKTKLSKLLCLDGTTLLNIGKREGFDFKVPTEVEDHIIRF